METNELVSILVPKRHLGKVYGFIGTLDAEDVAADAEPASPDPAEGWDRDLIERQYQESPKSMKAFLKWLADHPGEEFTTAEMADSLNVAGGWNSVAGMLGAYGNRVKNRYKRSTFPFGSRWDYGQGTKIHWMTPEVAEIIKAL